MNPVELPSAERLAPYLAKLTAEPAGVVLIAIQTNPEAMNYFAVSTAFLSADERKALRAGLQRAKAKREAAKEDEA